MHSGPYQVRKNGQSTAFHLIYIIRARGILLLRGDFGCLPTHLFSLAHRLQESLCRRHVSVSIHVGYPTLGVDDIDAGDNASDKEMVDAPVFLRRTGNCEAMFMPIVTYLLIPLLTAHSQRKHIGTPAHLPVEALHLGQFTLAIGTLRTEEHQHQSLSLRFQP